MPMLDMSDCLCDPDFNDTLQVTRNTQVINNNGYASLTTRTWKFVGVVSSGGGKRLDRGAAGEREVQTIMVVTKTKLSSGRINTTGAAETADIVTWHGLTYTVVQIDDYSHYGQGFIQATCELLPLSG